MKRIVLLAALLMGSVGHAQVYKCNEGGRVVFSDYPCQRTDNKTVDVRPAAGGPVNRSSEYWERQRRRLDEEIAAEDKAERERAEEARRQHLDAVSAQARAQARAAQAEEKRQQQEAEEANRKRKEERARSEAMILRLRPSKDMSCWKARFEKDEFAKMDALIVRFMGAESIASSTPKQQLLVPIFQLQAYREELAKMKFSAPCLENMSTNALMYTDSTLALYRAFLASDDVPSIRNDAKRYLDNYQYGKSIFGL